MEKNMASDTNDQYKVVIIDDEERIVEGLQRVIDWSKYNCKVISTAYDSKTGAQIIRENSPDILFTDIKMPNIDGLTMLSSLKVEFPDMQISVLTGYRDFDYAKKAIQLGVTRFLLKPSKMNELEEALEAMTNNLAKLKAPRHIDDEPLEKNEAENCFIVRNAQKYINEHYTQKLTLTELAEKVYVSQWYLSKLLNKYTGQSFYEILNYTRIKKAKQLLKDPSIKIHEISEITGFNDVAHFCKVFRKLEQMSPNEYRNGL